MTARTFTCTDCAADFTWRGESHPECPYCLQQIELAPYLCACGAYAEEGHDECAGCLAIEPEEAQWFRERMAEELRDTLADIMTPVRP